MSIAQEQKVLGDLAEHAKIFRLDEHRLGERLLDIAAEEVEGLFLDQKDADGNDWPDLSEEYEKWKATHSSSSAIGTLWGMMSDPANIAGVRAISADEATMTYGVTQAARDEAEWFQEGNAARNQPPRQFYALSAQAESRIGAFLDSHFSSQRSLR
jgi:hypothetical protein